jgi:signal transduction histidine kinase
MQPGADILATIDLLPEPMLLVDVDGAILAANHALAQQLGLPRDALIHRQLDALVTESAAEVRDYLQRCAASGQFLLGALTLRLEGAASLRCRADGAAFRGSWQDARDRAVMLRLVPAAQRGSAFIALNEKIHQLNGEIARRKFIEGALRKAEQATREADRRKDEFLATLAHELRNPLAPIRNAMQIMAVSNGDEARIANARAMVERQLKHMVRLIDDLMDVSRITQDRLELRRQRVALEEVIQIAIETCRPALERKRQQLRIESSCGAVHVDADITRLAQALSNLLDNSSKYSAPGADICIATSRQDSDDYVDISVSDSGVGIPLEGQRQIFDMFVQLDQPGEREGLGLGLTLVKRIVELHGGSVHVFSEGAGKGSTLRVRLAVAPPEGATHADASATAVREAEPADRHPGNHGSRARILVADDNRDAAESLALMLGLEGHDVRMVYNGIDALALAEQFRPQIVLLDIGMPLLDGYQTARQIREQSWAGSVLLVALTGWGQEADRRQARDAGFDRHLLKPVDPQDLNGLIRQATMQ